MNIKEVEMKSGLTRANIRFYENEGLLSPIRKENGYRDYSEKDLELLKRIRLMRELGISLEQIKQLQNNPDALNRLMRQRIEMIEREKNGLDDRKIVCSEIQTEETSFDRLEAERYLRRLETLARERSYGRQAAGYQPAVKADEEPFVPHPWKRYLARMIDITLCNVLWLMIWGGILGMLPLNGAFGTFIDTVMGMLLLLLLEPVCLSCFSTTLGKWIFGISIRNEDGSRIKWGTAVGRTRQVLLHGMGLQVPGYELYRLYRSRKEYVEGWTPEWDQDLEYQIRDRKEWKVISGVVVTAAMVFGSTWLLSQYQLLPVNRGDLTIAEFSENYNRYVKLLNAGEDVLETVFLKEDGTYVSEEELERYGQYIIDLGDEKPLKLRYQQENGVLTGISFEQNVTTDFIIYGYKDEMIYATLAFIGAQEEISIWNQGILDLVEWLEEVGFEDLELDMAGVHLSWEIETKGLGNAGDFLVANEGETGEMSVKFVMEKVKK